MNRFKKLCNRLKLAIRRAQKYQRQLDLVREWLERANLCNGGSEHEAALDDLETILEEGKETKNGNT